MKESLISFAGLAAGFLTTAAYVPQVWRVWKTRSTRDISLGTFLALCLGLILWVVYGILAGSLAVILANSATLVLASIILVLKLKHG
jgi:MtN3 and saliva related transmembrane protein